MESADKADSEAAGRFANWNGPELLKNAVLYCALILVGSGIGLSVVRMSWKTAIIAAAGVLLIGLLVRQIAIPFYLAVFSLITLQEVEVTPGSMLEIFANYKAPGVPSLLEISIVLLLVCFLVKYFLQREPHSISIFRLPFILFLILYFLSYFLGLSSDNNEIFIKEDVKKFIFPVLFFLCSANLLDSTKKIGRLVVFVILVSTLKIYMGIISYLNGTGFAYGNVNVVFVETADLILVVTVTVAMVAMVIFRKITWKTLVLLVLTGAPLLFSLVYSNRRNAWLGILLALALLFFITPVRLKPRVAMVVLCAGLAGLCMISISMALHGLPSGQDLKQRFTSISDREDHSNETHVSEWVVTIEDLKVHPLFGMGFGAEHAPVPTDDTINRHTVHNAFLMLYMKMGVGTVILFIWCLIRYFKFAVGLTEAEARNGPNPLRIGLFSTFAYWLVTLNVAPSWWYYRESCMMALVAAIVIQLTLIKEEEAPAKEPAALPAVGGLEGVVKP